MFASYFVKLVNVIYDKMILILKYKMVDFNISLAHYTVSCF